MLAAACVVATLDRHQSHGVAALGASAPNVTRSPTSDVQHIDIPMTEFLRFPSAVEYLVRQGFEDPVALAQTEAGRGRLLPYLPARPRVSDATDDDGPRSHRRRGASHAES